MSFVGLSGQEALSSPQKPGDELVWEGLGRAILPDAHVQRQRGKVADLAAPQTGCEALYYIALCQILADPGRS